MPRARFFNLPPRARSRLLRIATRHFAGRGLEGASLNEILAEAGISKGAYYYYFDDKDDLLATVMEDAVEQMVARVPMPEFDGLRPENFWPAVEQFVENWAATVDMASDLFKVAVQFSGAQRRSERFAPVLAKAQSLYRLLIETGQRLGCVRADLPTEVLIRLLEANDAVLDSIFLALHDSVTTASVREHTRLVCDTIKRLLVAEAPAAKPRTGSRQRRRR